jgi:23S rRNA U2552 (ribose-2'-O)-methylase RlmE/FtsJ
MESYPIEICQIPICEKISVDKMNIISSSKIAHPMIQYGFHQIIHETKDKMKIVGTVKNKNTYLVNNKFERYVDKYDNDIGNVSKKYFKLDNKPKILSRAFYKLWELIFMFDLIPSTPGFTSAHLAEGPGSFIQATIMYREMVANAKKDNYHAITLHPSDLQEYIPKLDKDFEKYYSKDGRYHQYKTHSTKQSAGSKKKSDGNLTNPKTIKLFSNTFTKKKVDLVTADGGFNWKDENLQEQEAFKLILGQVTAALKIQKKGGNFICKLFETFTKPTLKILNILSVLYEKVILIKPYMSRESNSEKYVVCLKYLDNNSKLVDKMEKLVESAFANPKSHIVDILSTLDLSKQFQASVMKYNSSLTNKQVRQIDKIVSFIKSRNYYGNEYNKSRDEQIKATKEWIKHFFPDKKDLSFSKKKIREEIEKVIERKTKQTTSLLKII